jgi:recombination protein RecR
MQVVPPALDRLIENLARLPGIGRKTATRLALNILRRPASQAIELAASLTALHGAIKLCSCCFTFSETDPCAICADPKRNGEIVCVV